MPTRTCIGCRRRADAAELVRFVRDEEGTVHFGPTLPGRGAWLCADTLDDCATLALRRRAFERALRGPIVPGSIVEATRAATRGAPMSVRTSGQNARG